MSLECFELAQLKKKNYSFYIELLLGDGQLKMSFSEWKASSGDRRCSAGHQGNGVLSDAVPVVVFLLLQFCFLQSSD